MSKSAMDRKHRNGKAMEIRESVPISGSVVVQSQFVPSATSDDVESDAEPLSSVPLQIQSDPLELLLSDEVSRRRLPSSLSLSLYVHAVPASDELDGLYPEYELDDESSTMAI